MENLYSVRLEAVMRARKGENQSECQTDLVAEERWNCLQLLDWSHSGLIAVAVNKCSVESVNGASVLQHCAIALFDANEPHVVAIRCTEHHPNAVMDFLSSDDKVNVFIPMVLLRRKLITPVSDFTLKVLNFCQI